MYNLKNKRNHGITLIALVITIIVLLILAAISLTMLTGDNSLLKRAGEAKEKTETATLKEEAELVMIDRATEKIIGRENLKTLRDELEEKISGTTVEWAEGLTDVCYVKRGNTEITVYEDGDIEEGKVEIWDGRKISCPEFKKENNVWNWYIYTPSQLKFLADFVNNGNKLDGNEALQKAVDDGKYDSSTVTISTDTIINLMKNLDMGARAYEGNTEEEKWETDTNEVVNWEPIGEDFITKFLGGTFDGNGYQIKGLYVKSENMFTGLFGLARNIKRLTIKNSYIKNKYNENTTSGVGGITGYSNSNIEDCHNINTTIVLEKYRHAGGIVGWKRKGTINNCTNTGKVIGKGKDSEEKTVAGGICGMAENGCTIINSNNNGFIYAEGRHVGGITGQIYGKSTIDECYNSGSIEGKRGTVGGIAGSISDNSIIKNSGNSGEITGKGLNFGGIVGIMTFLNPNNAAKCTIEKCYNNGKVNGEYYLGGIIGRIAELNVEPQFVRNCYNKGELIENSYSGEVIGSNGNTNDETSLYNLFYKQNSRNLKAIGGVNDDENKKITGVENDLTYEQFKLWIEEQ